MYAGSVVRASPPTDRSESGVIAPDHPDRENARMRVVPEARFAVILRHWPLVGVFCATCVFVFAASLYPGGTKASAESVGYDWANNTVSALFRAKAVNGAPNPARYFAIPAVWLFCGSMGMVFAGIAGKATSSFHGKTIRIGGIGSMVFASLAATPWHNLMVTAALLFFMAAVFAILHRLYVERRMRLLMLGLVCVSLQLTNAVMYYGHVLRGMLPVVQKAGSLACVGWLFTLYYLARTERRPTRFRSES